MFPNPQLAEMGRGLAPLVFGPNAAFQQQLQAAMNIKSDSPPLKHESSSPPHKPIKSELQASDEEEEEPDRDREEEEQPSYELESSKIRPKSTKLKRDTGKVKRELKSETNSELQIDEENDLENDRVS